MMTRTMAAAALLGLASVLAGCTSDAEFDSDAPITTAASDYAQFCADCHGTKGRGDGAAAASVTPRPADLTTISRRNGGTYPRLQVMNRIYGYTMGASDSPMPAFGPLLEGKTVLFDAGDGIETPTPWRLVALQDYVERMQR